MSDFSNRTVLITGAGGAIGGALARGFAAEGARLLLTDLVPEALEAVCRSLPGTDILALAGDLAKEDDIAKLAQAGFERFGTVDILVNNAAVSVYAPIWELPVEHITWMFEVNVLGIVHVLRQFLPRLIEAKTPGHVVNIASLSGMIGQATMAGYSASKHAVIGLTESLREDLRATGVPIGVSLVTPGAVKSQGMKAMRQRVLGLADQALAQRMAAQIDVLDALVQNGIEPDAVARQVIEAVKKNLFWVICPPALAQVTGVRAAAIKADLAAAEN